MQNACLTIEGVYKFFAAPDGTECLNVLNNINIKAQQGEFIGIIGPSGCGKSTLLNMVCGFQLPDKGKIFFGNCAVQDFISQMAVVFQTAALFPWLSIADNIAYGLKSRGENKRIIRERTGYFIKLLGLEGFEDYYPEQISGGMQQRVAIARALILQPKILLMDEPFAALDAQSRLAMQQLLVKVWQEFKPTVLFVTHDVEEILYVADRVYVMSQRPGRIITEIIVSFERPRSSDITCSTRFCSLKNKLLELLMNKSQN